MNLILFFVSCLPSFLQKPLRRMLGAKIHSSAKVDVFAIVLARDLELGANAKISSFVFIKAESLKMGEHAIIRPLSILKVRRLEIGDYTLFDPLVLVNCTYGPRALLKVGRHSRVQSFSQLEPSEGIYIGDQVALGGQCLVFCHGSWSNYLRGSPYSRGPVHIENEVWVSWRAMILANSHIGARAIIGAHSMVHGKVAPNALYLGVPARMVLENAWKELTTDDRTRRMEEIIAAFRAELVLPARQTLKFADLTDSQTLPEEGHDSHTVAYSFSTVAPNLMSLVKQRSQCTLLDFERLVAYGTSREGLLFVDFLESFGVRMDRKDLSGL